MKIEKVTAPRMCQLKLKDSRIHSAGYIVQRGRKNVWAVQWKALHSRIGKVFSPDYFWKPNLHSSIILPASLLPEFWERGGRILGGNGV